MLKRFLGTVLFLSAGAMVQAQQLHTMSVKDAVAYGMQNAIAVKNALLDINIQKEVNKEITAAAYPSLMAKGNIIDYLAIPTQQLPGEFFGQPGTFIPVKFGTKYNASGGFDLNQLLFDGQVFVGLQARNASIRLVEAQKAVTDENVAANIEKVYYQLVVGQKQMASIDANVQRLEKLEQDTKEIFKNGFNERLDVDKVSVTLNNIRTEKEKVQNSLDAGYAGLKFLMHMPQTEKIILTDTLNEEKLKEDILNPQVNYSDRKDYKVLDAVKTMNEYNIKRHKLSYFPTVALFGSYSANAQRQKFDFFQSKKWFNTAYLGLNVTVPVFDGFLRRSRINQAKLQLQKTQNTQEILRSNIDMEVEQAKLKLASSLKTIDLQKRNMDLAERVYNTTKLKYEQGMGSNMEIYNAQAEYRVAQSNYFAAMYDAIIAKVDYMKAAGRFDETLK